MTQPRRIVPGATYLVTRRCAHRAFRLKPSPLTNQVFAYCLARALEQTGVVLHAVCVMSNHHHLVVTDIRGELPIFLRELHRSIAKALNVAHGARENLWAARPCSVVQLVDAEEVIEKIAYVAANPTAAGLVKKPEHWPGLIAWKACAIRVRRPSVYFDEEGTSPEWAALNVERPPSDPQGTRVMRALCEHAHRAHRAMAAAHRRFVGRAGVLAKSFFKRARSFEPRVAVVPTIAARESRVRSAASGIQRAFRRAYRLALTLWQSGNREVQFPFGTWWMRVHHAAACAEVTTTAA